MSIRFLKLSLASPESIRSWTERILPNGKRVGKILKGDLIDYKNGLPIRDGLSCERIFGPMVSFTCTCGRFKCIETRGIHIVHDTLRSSRPILPDVSRQSSDLNVKQWDQLESSFQTSSDSSRFEKSTHKNPIVSQNTVSKPVQKLVSNEKPSKTSKERFKSAKSIQSSKHDKDINYLLSASFVGSQQSPHYGPIAWYGDAYNPLGIFSSLRVEMLATPCNDKQSLTQESKPKNLQQKTRSYLNPLSAHMDVYRQKKMIRFLSDFYYDYQYIYHLNKTPQISLMGGQIIPPFVVFCRVSEEPSNTSLKNQWPVVKNFFKRKTVQYPSKKQKWPMSRSSSFFYPISNKSQTVELKIHSSIVQNLFQPLYKFIFQIYTKFWFDLKVHYNNFIYEKYFFFFTSHQRIKNKKIYDNHPFAEINASLFNKFRIQGLHNKSQKLPIINRAFIAPASVSGSYGVYRGLQASIRETRGMLAILKDPETYKRLHTKQWGHNESFAATQTSFLNIRGFNSPKNGITTNFQKSLFLTQLCLYWSPKNKNSVGTDIKNIPNRISLLVKKPLLLKNVKSGKRTNISLDSLKTSWRSLDFKPREANIFKASVDPERGKKNLTKADKLSISSCKIDKSDKNQLLRFSRVFNSLKKHERIRPFATSWNPTKIDQFSNSDRKTRDRQEVNGGQISSLSSSWTKPLKSRETFSSKGKADTVPLNLATSNNVEDGSKSYMGSNTKQNIRVYKFKNFPPEEIRYCPYCEVELLPNSIRRYRLGYIEFVSPVTHIWYTASSIPLLLNLSKTMIEGIASCHEALSSGFPPVYKWSYNGESPTSWTFQMQPLKLPINSPVSSLRSAKMSPSSKYSAAVVKKPCKGHFTEINLGSNSIVYLSLQGSQKPFQANNLGRLKPAQVLPIVFSMGKHDAAPTHVSDTYSRVRPRLSFQGVASISKLSDGVEPRGLQASLSKASGQNSTACKHHLAKLPVFQRKLCQDVACNPRAKRWECLQPLETQVWTPSFEILPHDRQEILRKKSAKAVMYTLRYPVNKIINYKDEIYKPKKPVSGGLLYNNWAPEKFLSSPINTSFEALSLNNLAGTVKYFPNSSSWKEIPRRGGFKNLLAGFLPVSHQTLPIDGFFHFEKKEKLSGGILSTNPPLLQGFPIKPAIDGVRGGGFDNKKNNGFTASKKKSFGYYLQIAINNPQVTAFDLSTETMQEFSFFGQAWPVVSFDANKWGETQTSRKAYRPPPCSSYDPYTATEYEKKREWLKLEGFFEDFSSKKLSDNSKESVFEDSNTKASFIDPNKQKNPKRQNSEANHKIQEQHLLGSDSRVNGLQASSPETMGMYPDQKPLQSKNEAEKPPTLSIGGENDSGYLDNLSLPLVLPFLGKNPDNIEFQNNYSNYEHFHRNPLKFITDLYSTQHIWDQTTFDPSLRGNHKKTGIYPAPAGFKKFKKPRRGEDQNIEQFTDKAPYHQFFGITTRHLCSVGNDIWNNACIAYNGPITELSRKSMPSVIYNYQTVPTKNSGAVVIMGAYGVAQNKNVPPRRGGLLKELEWNLSETVIVSPRSYKQNEQTAPTGFCSSLNPFYIIADNLFSQTCPFFPLSFQNWSPNRVQTEFRSNYQPMQGFINDSKNTVDFRKLGRNIYYFKLEQMARLENAFFKNVFYRNKFHKTSVLKNPAGTVLAFSLIPSSVFYSINNNKKTKPLEGIKQNFTGVFSSRIKPPGGFPSIIPSIKLATVLVPSSQQTCGVFSRRRNPDGPCFESQENYPWRHNPQSLDSFIKPPWFFSRKTTDALFVPTVLEQTRLRLSYQGVASISKPSDEIGPKELQALSWKTMGMYHKKPLKTSLWPLKPLGSINPAIDGVGTDYKKPRKGRLNNFNGTFTENLKDIHHIWPFWSNTLQNNLLVLNQPKSTSVFKNIIWPSRYSCIEGPLKTKVERLLFMQMHKQCLQLSFLTPNLPWKFSKPKSNLLLQGFKNSLNTKISMGMPVSIIYDFIISRSHSLMKNISSLQKKQLQKERPWPVGLQNLCIEKNPVGAVKWIQNQHFPAVSLEKDGPLVTSQHFKNTWLQTCLSGYQTTISLFEKRVNAAVNSGHEFTGRLMTLKKKPVKADNTGSFAVFQFVKSIAVSFVYDDHKQNQLVEKQAFSNFKKTALLKFEKRCFSYKPNFVINKTFYNLFFQECLLLKQFVDFQTNQEIIGSINQYMPKSILAKIKFGPFFSKKNSLSKRWWLSNSTDSVNPNKRPCKVFGFSGEAIQVSWPSSKDFPFRRTIKHDREFMSRKHGCFAGSKKKLGYLALLSLDTTQIEFFGSLKIYAKRKFLKVCSSISPHLKPGRDGIPFLFGSLGNYTSLNYYSSTIKALSNQNPAGAVKRETKWFPFYLSSGKATRVFDPKKNPQERKTHLLIWLSNMFRPTSPKKPSAYVFNTTPVRFLNQNSHIDRVGAVFKFDGKKKNIYPNPRNWTRIFDNKVLKSFIFPLWGSFFSSTDFPFRRTGKPGCEFRSRKHGYFDSQINCFTKPKIRHRPNNSNTDFLEYFSLYQNKQKAIILPWKKLQSLMQKLTLSQKKICRGGVYFPILLLTSWRYKWINNSNHLNALRLSKLLVEPQTTAPSRRNELKHVIIKRHKHMVCNAYAIETIQNKNPAEAVVYSRKYSRPVKNFESESKNFGGTNCIQSLSSKISCFSYFGYDLLNSFDLTSKIIIQKNLTYNKKKIIHKTRASLKQIPLIKSFDFNIVGLSRPKNVSVLRPELTSEPHQSAGYRVLNLAGANKDRLAVSEESFETQIFRWGRRGHIFNRLISPRINRLTVAGLHNNTKNRQEVLSRTNDHFLSANGSVETSQERNEKISSYYSNLPSNEKQKGGIFQSNTNYYACLSQITSWGSDHGSWILFLKYIRANIYKGDQLLPSYLNKMNFQMMPRTGSIMLQQLLSQASVVFQKKTTDALSIPSFETDNALPNISFQPKQKNETQLPLIAKTRDPAYESEAVDSEVNSGRNYNIEPLGDFKSNFELRENLFNHPTSHNICETVKPQWRLLWNPKELWASEMDTWQNFASNTINYNDMMARKFIKKTDHGLVIKNMNKNNQYFYSYIYINNVPPRRSGFFTIKRNRISTNKYILYAYKIKKPVSYKRFRQISEPPGGSLKFISNWYRLNNFFSYSYTTLNQVEQKNQDCMNFSLVQSKRDYTEDKPQVVHPNSNFVTTPRSMTFDHKPDRGPINDSSLSESASFGFPSVSSVGNASVSSVGNDRRILKLVYSLIISFKPRRGGFLPTRGRESVNGQAEKKRSAETRRKFLPRFDEIQTNNLFSRISFIDSYRVPLPFYEDGTDKSKGGGLRDKIKQNSVSGTANKAINKHPNYEISNAYYHIYCNKPFRGDDTNFKHELWDPKSLIYGLLNKPFKHNHLYSRLSVLDNIHTNRDPINIMATLYSNQNYSPLRYENFYFSDQKPRRGGIYNILISPLDFTSLKFSNFGFPTTAFDFINSKSNHPARVQIITEKKPATARRLIQGGLHTIASPIVTRESKPEPPRDGLKTQASPIAYDLKPVGRNKFHTRGQITTEAPIRYAKLWGSTKKWSYMKLINRLVGHIKPYDYAISHDNSPLKSLNDSLKVFLENSQKNELGPAYKKDLNLLKAGFRPVLPINLDTYKGQITGEALFIKLKEIGNYNLLIKKKNTLFKTLILKMNSSLQPLLSKNCQASVFFNFPSGHQASVIFQKKNTDAVVTGRKIMIEKNKALTPVYNTYSPFNRGQKQQKVSLIEKKKTRIFHYWGGENYQSAISLEFLRIWLFLNSIHGPEGGLHWFNNFQNHYKAHSILVTKKPVLGRPYKIKERSNTDFFPKILQFYEYRKNFLLKKIFKQRLSLTQASVFFHDDITHTNPVMTGKRSILDDVTYKGLTPVLGPESGSAKAVLGMDHRVFHGKTRCDSACRFKSKFSEASIWFEVYTLLKRRINSFYDQERNASLKIKYEFKPFGPQIKHSSTYSNWKIPALRGLKYQALQGWDLSNSTVESFKNQTRFRLLTVPQIFDIKDQNNGFTRIRKNETVINFLGPLFFSSQMKPSRKRLAFPVLKASKNKPFWSTNIMVDNNSQNFEYSSPYNTTRRFLNNNRPLSSETLFREENLKVSSSYKALLQKAKILEDYPVPDTDPIDSNTTCLRLLNCGLPRPIWWNFQTWILGEKLLKLPSFRTNKVTWKNSKKTRRGDAKTPAGANSLSQFIWDGNQNKFRPFSAERSIGSKDKLLDPSTINNLMAAKPSGGKGSFSMRDWTKFENNSISNIKNNGSSVPEGFFGQTEYDVSGGGKRFQVSSFNLGPVKQNKFRLAGRITTEAPTRYAKPWGRIKNEQNNSKIMISEPKKQVDPFSNHQETSLRNTDLALKTKNGRQEVLPSDKSKNLRKKVYSRRSSTLNYGRNLRKLRLQYLRNFRRLRFIEYLKATYIKPEWMILSLLPVLPPDLRPVIANPRGYITGDINTHYQNVIYRNNNIEKLLDTFWIPRKFYSKISFSNHLKATAGMLSSRKSYLHSVSYLPTYRIKPFRGDEADFENYGISKIFSKLASVPLTFTNENRQGVFEPSRDQAPIKNNKGLVSLPDMYSSIEGKKSINKSVRVLQSRPYRVLKSDKAWNFKGSQAFSNETSLLRDFWFSNSAEAELDDQKKKSASVFWNTLKNTDLSMFKNIFKTNANLGLEKELVEIAIDKFRLPNWKLERLISPMFSKFTTTSDFDFELSLKGSLGGPIKENLEASQEQFKIQETRDRQRSEVNSGWFNIQNTHKAVIFNHAPLLKSFIKNRDPAYESGAVDSEVNSGRFQEPPVGNRSIRDQNSKVSKDLKLNSVPALETKIIRTQALHDSKPLQEMQYSLQKAVDALIDNSQKLQSNVLLRKGRPLKSLSDNLKGKEGRFRQHLLGKRVDYSGRSVIVVGPDLKLYECGIPLIMALRLFQPFLILYLIYRFKIASLLATQLIQRKHPMVINLLKKFIETWPILLNRAPTLHRMNIQAFKIRLVQGKAILLHPLVCSSYNADFDGDQMGVHIPITQQARAESWKLLWSINNSIAIASRQPLFLPSQDMVIGNYYLTAPPIDDNFISLMPKMQWPFRFKNGQKKTVFSHQLTTFSSFDRQWINNFQKMNHYFFSLEEAYQYYLNTAYRFHVNTPVWFYFGMIFETSEPEKAIEITIDKHGNSKIVTKYYEKQLKRNRILGKNAFYFNTYRPLLYSNSSISQHISNRKLVSWPSIPLVYRWPNKPSFFGNPRFAIPKVATAFGFKNFVYFINGGADFFSMDHPFKKGNYHAFLITKGRKKLSTSLLKRNGQTTWRTIYPPAQANALRGFFTRTRLLFDFETKERNKKLRSFRISDQTMILPYQTIFKGNLNPILLNQIIRSTFGRIEFYYEAFYVCRSELTKNNK